jgi:hypothetical protein
MNADWRINIRETSRKLGDLWEAVFGFPLFGGVTAALGVLAGFLGSINDKAIESAGFHLLHSRQSTEFWASVIAVGICFSGTVWAQSRAARRDRIDMLRETDRLKALVNRLHSLPPTGYLGAFEGAINEAGLATVLALSRPATTHEELEKAIRIVLATLLQLARQFHVPDFDGTRYSVNIMLYKPIQPETSDAEIEELESRMKFFDKTGDIRRLRGCLELHTIFSTSSDDTEKPDATLRPLVLPIPYTKSEASRDLVGTSVLPGAPWTFVTGDASGFPNIDIVAERAERGDFAPSLIESLREYFKEAKERGNCGMVSLALPAYPAYRVLGDATDGRMGVLNIHRNVDNFMGEGQLELFAPLAAPFCALLARLLATYESKRAMLHLNTTEENHG